MLELASPFGRRVLQHGAIFLLAAEKKGSELGESALLRQAISLRRSAGGLPHFGRSPPSGLRQAREHRAAAAEQRRQLVGLLHGCEL